MTALRSILHVDMDAFFASVEQLDDPALRGKPIVVGHDGPRGVVSTASYEARPYGCRSAMPVAVAKRLCPHVIVVPPRFARYREISDQIFGIFERYSPLIQPLSVDEAFIDVTGSERLFGDAVSIAKSIRSNIRDEVQLTASVGVAPNKFLAKLASDLDKPDGLTIIWAEDVGRVLPPLPISKIWGIGPKTTERMTSMGLRTIGDLLRLPVETLTSRFGEEGSRYARLARGIDDRPVTPNHDAKGISQEQTFGVDLIDPDQLRSILLGQCEMVAATVRRRGFRASVVTMKLRDAQFKTLTRSQSIDSTDVTSDLWATALSLFNEWAVVAFRPVRLIGLSAGGLTREPEQLALFGHETRQRQRQVDQTLDKIRNRFGKGAIGRGKNRDSAR